MFDTLKEIAVGEMLTIDEEAIHEFTNSEDFKVLGLKVYSQDEGEIVILDIDNFYLVAHTFEGEPRYFIYEQNGNGVEEDLEEDGYRLVFKDEPLPHKVFACRNDKELPYKRTSSPVYGLNVERDESSDGDEPGEIAICEFKSKSSQMTHILVEMLDDNYIIYQGFEVDENNIVL